MNSKLIASTALAAAALLALSGCAGSTPSPSGGVAPSDSQAPASQSIVIDASFDAFETMDPARARSSMGVLTAHALYETLVTYEGGDMATAVPGLASLEIADEFKTFTFTLVPDRKFASGNAVTTDDVVFSLQRVQNLGTNNSVPLEGLKIEKVDESVVKITSETPNAALPAILAAPGYSVIEKAAAVAAGGTTDENDAAEASLNATSIGSGPYIIEKGDFTAEIVLALNPNYNGPQKPGYSRVILRKADASTQKMSLEAGESQVALDLSPAEGASLDPSMVYSTASVANVYAISNFSKLGVDTLTGLKAAIDYSALTGLAGAGAKESTGLIPRQFAGAAPEADAPKFDIEKAKKYAAGYTDTIKLSYLSDASIYGLQFTSLAEKLQAQWQAAGFKVELAPTPGSVFWDDYVNGKLDVGLAYWMPDYLDPAGYLVFSPTVDFGRVYANWDKGSPELVAAVEAASTAADETARIKAFEDFGRLSNAESPFIPIFQPALNIGHAANVSGLVYNAGWTIDVALLQPVA
ncbi:MAG: ABC transporter substrate-binding protein [Propionibacteriaceae bacterium]|jgi:peptide/nickel transport system substrate-binding protein|nr:ABC transporter substrate-binding protein [Propionibacteriaceae bacterium]